MKPLSSTVTQHLDALAIPYGVIEIPLADDLKPIRSLEALLSAQGIDPGSVVRSVLFKTDPGGFCLLAVASQGRADWALLRAHCQVRKCRMAELEEVLTATGYAVGAVPPIALPSTVRVLVDASVQSYDTVVIGSGVLGYALTLRTQDLFKCFINNEIGNFVKVE